MSNIYIVTDSTADLPRAEQEEHRIRIVPLTVRFGDESYLDGVDLTPESFYEKLISSDVLPSTSQPSPADFMSVYEQIFQEDASAHIISIHISSVLSGTYQSAILARNLLEKETAITVVDAKTTCYGLGLMAVEMAKAAARGASVERCVEKAMEIRKAMRLYFIVDTLEYLQRGGRIGKAAALAGSLLNIKPILTIDDEGEVASVEKVRGRKRAMNRILELLGESFTDTQPLRVFFAHSNDEEAVNQLLERMKANLHVKEHMYTMIGPVLGTHTGPGTVGIIVAPVNDD